MAQRIFTDMIGRQVLIKYPPRRIISVVPSQTELLFDLGLEEEVVGITKFCIHPNEWFRNKERIGGTKKLNIDKIKALNPDLIIANKEENKREQIEELAAHFPIWISDIVNLDDSLRMIQEVGMLVDREEKAYSLAKDIAAGFQTFSAATTPRRVIYFIWYRPWMSVGGDTFISNIIKSIGWKNVLEKQNRYPEITLEQLREHQPELVLLTSEPFPFKEKHVAEVKAALPNVEVLLVNGEMFSWYGSRLLHAISYLEGLVKNTV